MKYCRGSVDSRIFQWLTTREALEAEYKAIR